MSKNAVKPPAASAALPVVSPSQCVRPGSLKCTCGSSPPGRTCRPRASISSRAPSSSGATAAISAVGDADVARRRRGRSDRAREPRRRVDRQRHVGLGHRLIGVVADAAGAAHEQHRDVGVAAPASPRRARRRWAAAGPACRSRRPPRRRARPARACTASRAGAEIGDQATPISRRCRDPAVIARSSAVAASRTASSWWRMSSVTSARPGITLTRAVRDVELADRRHQPRLRAGHALGGEHELGRGGERVAAQVHRRRPGVRGVAGEGEVEAALAGDRRDHAERQALGVEHRALLDVDLEVGARRRVVTAARPARRRAPRPA